MNANNYPKLLERRFLNATLIYFKISIANVAIALCHGGVPTRMTRSIIVGPLFSLYLLSTSDLESELEAEIEAEIEA